MNKLIVFIISLCFLLPAAKEGLARSNYIEQPNYLLAKNSKQKTVRIIPKQRAVRRAKNRHKGKVLSVKLKKAKSKNPYYRVKMLEKGKVRVIRIRAKE